MRTLRMLTLTALTVTALAVAIPALAGGGGHAGGACEAYASGDVTEVVLRDNCFAPVSATAPAAGTVTIRNDGRQPHTYTAVDGSFDTGVLQPGDSTTVELPKTSGTLPVYCTLHADAAGNGMAGTISLAATGGTTASAAGLGSSGIALAGGFVLGSATLGAIRKRRTSRHTEAMSS